MMKGLASGVILLLAVAGLISSGWAATPQFGHASTTTSATWSWFTFPHSGVPRATSTTTVTVVVVTTQTVANQIVIVTTVLNPGYYGPPPPGNVYYCDPYYPNDCYYNPNPNYPYGYQNGYPYGYPMATTTETQTLTSYSTVTETSVSTVTTTSVPEPVTSTTTLTSTTVTTDTTLTTVLGGLMALFLVLFLAALLLLWRGRSTGTVPSSSNPSQVRASYRCSACGNEVEPKTRFCGSCGVPLKH